MVISVAMARAQLVIRGGERAVELGADVIKLDTHTNGTCVQPPNRCKPAIAARQEPSAYGHPPLPRTVQSRSAAITCDQEERE
jgi:hypothetical protein